MTVDLDVLRYDSDFEHIAAVTGQDHRLDCVRARTAPTRAWIHVYAGYSRKRSR